MCVMQATPTTRRRPLHVACIVCSIWCRAAKYKLSTVDILYKKIAKRIGALYRSKSLLPFKYRKMFVNALMLPQFDYLDIIWCRAAKYKLSTVDTLYKKVAKIALNVDLREPSLKFIKG